MDISVANFANIVSIEIAAVVVYCLFNFDRIKDFISRHKRIHAFNNKSERIESMRFSVPALHAGVMSYSPGELDMTNTSLEGKTVLLYYPEEEVSSKDFLKRLETAPVVVGGHGTTTNENNKKIDGWPLVARYDAAEKAAIVDGVVKGAKEIAYIRENNKNYTDTNFGASAHVDFRAEIKSGVTPDGQQYNAIARDLRPNHLALAPSVRDPENKIEVRNSVSINTIASFAGDKKTESKTTGVDIKSEVKQVEISKEELAAVVENAISKSMTAKNEADRFEKMENAINEIGKGLEEVKKTISGGSEKKEEAANAEGEEKKEEKAEKGEEDEGKTVENCKPSQALVGAFATALNMDFGTKTPSHKTLAALSGISETDPIKIIAAVNAKFAELTAAGNKTAKNTSAVGNVFGVVLNGEV